MSINGALKKADAPAQWLVRAIIIGLLGWASSTLISVDSRMAVLEFRMTIIEKHHVVD